MAIYTNYARYLKAKEFKKMIEDQGDTYMLLGLGNPFWDAIPDDSESGSHEVDKMPVAPFNTNIMLVDTPNSNQFYDNKCYQSFIQKNITEALVVNDTVIAGSPVADTYADIVQHILPPFPCYWHDTEGNKVIYSSQSNSDCTITVGEYSKYYLDHSTNKVNKIEDGGVISVWPNEEEMPYGSDQSDIINRQVYADLYLRGLAIGSNIKHPVGLLGAVRCNISFVKDIGANESAYQGKANQIWYGDRFWEILDDDPFDAELRKESGKTILDSDNLPHHLLFNATINPMQLCADLKIDQNIVPRQIAIFVRKRIEGLQGPKYYPVNDSTAFNFGQYTSEEWESLTIENKLNFALPVSNGTDKFPGSADDDTDFKYLLSDYIKGSVRDKHSIDRIGYVLGF